MDGNTVIPKRSFPQNGNELDFSQRGGRTARRALPSLLYCVMGALSATGSALGARLGEARVGLAGSAAFRLSGALYHIYRGVTAA